MLFVSVAASTAVPVNSCVQSGTCAGVHPTWLDNIAAFCAYSTDTPMCCQKACKLASCVTNGVCQQLQLNVVNEFANQECTKRDNFRADITGCCSNACRRYL